tara:strand:+ start:394 stop:957 length:564 start_codon:yes stop_codon:yes gene_type:complete
MKKNTLKVKLSKTGRKNIAIIGHMGSGKSTIGKLLSKSFNFQHIDSDKKIIDYTGKSINTIFEENGEGYFREIESKILLKLIDKKNIILSLGGGAILNKDVRNSLKKQSITLFLDVDLITLNRRLENSSRRPLLKNVNIKKKIKELDSKRRKYYLNSDIKIDISYKDPSATCKYFIEQFLKFDEKNY